MPHSPKTKSGFALVIALSLMAFVLLLILSIGTLVQVETQNAELTNKQLNARENALTGLMVAVGRLQQYGGPDRRATATAEILGSVPDLNRLDVANPHWTGVWEADSGFDPDEYTSNPNPKLMTWLVSGMNDFETPNLLQRQVEIDMQANVLDGPTSPDLVRLVTPKEDANGNLAGGVVVPLESIDTRSKFAYWIADEGVKASVGLTDPLFGESLNGIEEAARVSVGQRFGIEQIGSGQTALAGLFDSDAPINRATDVDSIAFASSDQIVAQSRLKSLQHDITLKSVGLPVNTVDGGLKIDLSRGLDDDLLTGNIYSNIPSGAQDKPIPQWGKLSDYFQGAPSGSVPVSAPTDTTQGYHPVLLQSRLLFGVHLEPMGVNGTGEDEFRVDLVFGAVMALWNPHGVTLEASDYIFDTPVAPSTGPGLTLEFPDGKTATGGVFTFGEKNPKPGIPAAKYNGYVGQVIEEAVNKDDVVRVRFGTRDPIAFAPGQVLVVSTQPFVLTTPLGGGVQTTGDHIVGEFNQIGDYDTLPEGARCVVVGIGEEEFIRIPGREPEDILTATQVGLDLADPSIPVGGPGVIVGNGFVALNVRYEGAMGINVYSAAGEALSQNTHYATTKGFKPTGNDILFQDGVKPSLLTVAHFINPSLSRGKGGFRNLADFNIRQIPDPDNVGVQGRNLFSSFNINSYVNFGNRVDFASVNIAEKSGRGFAGRSFLEKDGQEASIIFNVLSEAPISLGQLQHANLRHGWFATKNGGATWEGYEAYDSQIPSFQIGNSRASMFVPVDEPDYVYRINHALWDDYFFSSAPRSVDFADPLPNPRIRFVDDLETRQDASGLISDRDRAAELLVIDGVFNVNSTSVDAWKAVFSSLGGVIQNNDISGELEAPFPGMLANVESRNTSDNVFKLIENHINYEALHPAEGGTPEIAERVYNGYRNLNEVEIQALAERMVEEVKVRGPFISLAQFVNRTLNGDLDPRDRGPEPTPSLNYGKWVADQRDTRMKGALQAAIDGATIEGSMNHNGNAPDLNEIVRLADDDPALGESTGSDPDGAQGIIGLGSMGIAPNNNDQDNNTYPFQIKQNRPQDVVTAMNMNSDDIAQNPWIGGYGVASADAPGFLSQMDILSSIAPFISTRSDTFKIRTYGSYTDPLTGDVESETWLEATVQRRHEYVDSNNSPEVRPGALTQINETFGRRFEIVNVRWLSADEI